jgi:hypothetical protein
MGLTAVVLLANKEFGWDRHVRDPDVRTACETYTDFVHQHLGLGHTLREFRSRIEDRHDSQSCFHSRSDVHKTVTSLLLL